MRGQLRRVGSFRAGKTAQRFRAQAIFSKGVGFISQHPPHSAAHSHLHTSSRGSKAVFSTLCGQHTYTWCIYILAGKHSYA